MYEAVYTLYYAKDERNQTRQPRQGSILERRYFVTGLFIDYPVHKHARERVRSAVGRLYSVTRTVFGRGFRIVSA